MRTHWAQQKQKALEANASLQNHSFECYMALMVELLDEQERLMHMGPQDDEQLNLDLENLGKQRKVHTLDDQFREGSVRYFNGVVVPGV